MMGETDPGASPDRGTDGVVIDERLVIPRSELEFRATRGGGPGGQHVNTSSTRIELWWDVASSPSLHEEQRRRVMERLSSKLDGSGRLRIVASEFRSQLQNRAAAEERFVKVVRRALAVAKPRRRTRPSRAAREARLQSKKRRSEVKRERGRREFD
jgi:ribosome-associated protein